jgi:hypothetical protein
MQDRGSEQLGAGTVYFYPFGAAVPVGLRRAPHRSGHLPAAGLALAGALMLGFGLRRRARGWLALAVFAAGALAGVAGISGCTAGLIGMTPGTYQYTITAIFEASGPAILGAQATTTINVTVP